MKKKIALMAIIAVLSIPFYIKSRSIAEIEKDLTKTIKEKTKLELEITRAEAKVSKLEEEVEELKEAVATKEGFQQGLAKAQLLLVKGQLKEAEFALGLEEKAFEEAVDKMEKLTEEWKKKQEK